MTEPALVYRALEPVVVAFEGLGIAYYIGGSVASSIYGVARATIDADLIAAVDEEHAERLESLLADDYYVDADMIRDAVRRAGMFNVVHLPTGMKIDIYVLKHQPWDEEAFRRRREDSLVAAEGARRVHFGSAEDILLHKLHWFRMGGEVSERQWRDVIGILRVQSRSLDFPYLKRWAPVLGVADLLAKAQTEIA